MRLYWAVLFTIFLFSCARPISWNVTTKVEGPFTYGPPTNVNFSLSSDKTGTTAVHTLAFNIKEGDLETYQSVITYPDAFTFNGFLALGPTGTQIGSYGVDFNFDGTIDFSIPIYVINNYNAYADRDINGSFNNSIDSTLTYSSTPGTHVLTTILPFGGDGSPGSITGPFTERIVAMVNTGIFTNPTVGGIYTLSGVFTSVDPDTDGPDDSAGDSPQILNFSRQIRIGPNPTGPIMFLLLD